MNNKPAWVEASVRWVDMHKAFKQHQAMMCKLIIHPEATEEEIIEVMRLSRTVYHRMTSSRDKLIKNYYANLNEYSGRSTHRLIQYIESADLLLKA